MIYFNAQGLVHEHRAKKRVVNCTMHHEQDDGLDNDDGSPTLDDIQRQWLDEVFQVGIT